MQTRYRSLLPHFLAALYGLSIAYASLQPFAPWIDPEPGTRFFLFATWPVRWTRFDVLANVLAYVPFGFFVAIALRDRPTAPRLLLATAAGTLLSFALESLQMFLPPRDASTVDLLANAAGSLLGAAAASTLLRSTAIRNAITKWRLRWFLHGRTGDLGLALLAIWLAVQVNPGIPLFATVFDVPLPAGAPAGAVAATSDVAGALIEGAHSALQVLGVGLFVALLVRERRRVGVSVLLLLGAGMLIKGTAAALLLKPAAWEHWLSPGVSAGVAVGALALPMVIFLPRPAQVAICAIALLSSVLSMLFVPEILLAQPPLSLFNRGYGHLLNFNGLTRTVLMLWPLAASGFLFALAGRPRWGDPLVGSEL
jgi:VanZ family protein